MEEGDEMVSEECGSRTGLAECGMSALQRSGFPEVPGCKCKVSLVVCFSAAMETTGWIQA